MDDGDKSKEVLIREIEQLRRKIVTLELSGNNNAEQNYRAVVEDQTELICRFLPGGVLTFVNDAYCRYFNKSRAELVGHSFIPLIPENDRQKVEEQVSSLSRDNPLVTYEHRVIVPSGGFYWQQWTDRALFDERGNLVEIQSVGRDITRLKQIEAELRQARDELEIRVQERTTDLTKANQELHLALRECKKAKEALHHSEDRFVRAFRSSPDIMAITTLEDGNYIEVNEAFLDITGYHRDQVMGKSVYDLNYWVKPGEYKKIVQMLKTQGIVRNLEVQFRTKAGKIRTGLYSFEVIYEDGQPHILGVAKDITENKRAEKALKESKRRIDDIIDFLPDATFVIDINGRALAWNRAAEDMTGVKASNILYKENYEYAIPFYGTRRPLLIDMVVRPDENWKQTYYDLELTGSSLNGEQFCPVVGESGAILRGAAAPLYDINGNVVGAIESIRDVTHRRRAEEALRSSEERFFKAFNFNPLPISISTFDEGRLINVNQSFQHYFGFLAEEAIGRTAIELGFWKKPEERAQLIARLHRQSPVRDLELEFHTKSGQIRTGLFSAEIVDLDGMKCMFTVINDITERKELEQEVAYLDRLNLMGETAASIAHEIRNPLTTVRGFLQILERQDRQLDKEYVSFMIEELDRANSIITEFLSLAKNKAVNLKLHNLNHILGSLYPLIQAEAMVQDKNVIMHSGEIPHLQLDEAEIRQLILNLTRNGLEAMNSGGVLCIETSLSGPEEVTLSVQDGGSGIEPEVLQNLGTPFLTTKDGGTGLGLAVCYRIAQRHNARIDVETSSEGTTFSVRFPITK